MARLLSMRKEIKKTNQKLMNVRNSKYIGTSAHTDVLLNVDISCSAVRHLSVELCYYTAIDVNNLLTQCCFISHDVHVISGNKSQTGSVLQAICRDDNTAFPAPDTDCGYCWPWFDRLNVRAVISNRELGTWIRTWRQWFRTWTGWHRTWHKVRD